MNTFQLWKTEVNATTSTLINVYLFSDKINLLLPYYLTLLVALPLLAIGGLSQYQNGISAADVGGGAFQILTTTLASKSLHEAASEGGLGGEENVPEDLKELKVKYGELIGCEEGSKTARRRVGFGVENKVIPIQRGVRYGGVGVARVKTDSVHSSEGAALLQDIS
jgi:hypothetical protein